MFRSGYVAIVGVPNVGKSTLMNRLLGEKLSIVTSKPQTTRHKILGIVHRPKAQILLLDTPGIHQSSKLLNEKIIHAALSAMGDADLVLHVVFPRPVFQELDDRIQEQIRLQSKKCMVLINQVDTIDKLALLPLIEQIQKQWNPAEIIPISARDGEGLDNLLNIIEKELPEGPAYYSEDLYTDQDVRFLCEEIVREKAMDCLHREIPYSLVTQVETFEETPRLARIQMAIVIEKSSQKPIVVGAKGSMIKKIGELARHDLESFLDKKVYLELFVKVVEGWTQNERLLKDYGITRT